MTLSQLFRPKMLLILIAILSVIWFSPQQIFAQTATEALPQLKAPTSQEPTVKESRKEQARQRAERIKQQLKEGSDIPNEAFKSNTPSIITQAIALSIFALLPFIIMILTSFLKIVIVLSLLRSALGVQQAPPNQIINGIAFMLSLFIMYPTGLKMYDIGIESVAKYKAPDSLLAPGSSAFIVNVANDVKEPLKEFLKSNSSAKHRAMFYQMAYRVLPEDHRDSLKLDDFILLVPSYITSQLKDAFEIGVLIYIPFFVIDLVTSNILLAMGMMMLSPVTISMPLKLFLLVMLDGWTLLVQGLVNTFSIPR